MKAIPTAFANTNFRSRLEARWAAFFDIIGWKWTYEPIDADGYIPDFLIHGNRPFFVEVGPCIDLADYRAKAAKADRSVRELGRDVLIVGVSPLADIDPDRMRGYAAAGLLGEFDHWVLPPGWIEPGPAAFVWDVGAWALCAKCRHVSVWHTVQSFTCRPCGHGDGDHYLGLMSESAIEREWREAGNQVQWMKENR